jgi:hypothetical protein
MQKVVGSNPISRSLACPRRSRIAAMAQASGVDAAALADSQGLPKVAYAKTERLLELLEQGEEVEQLGLAHLRYTLPIVGEGLSPELGKAVNQLRGGVLALTDRRLVYRAETLVGKSAFAKGNEFIAIPRSRIEQVDFSPGRGWGDLRRTFSITLHGGTLVLEADGETHRFIEVKPIQRAGEMAAAIRSGLRDDAS